MVKLIGKNKIKTAVFISGAGSNLKNLIKFSRYDKSPIQINCIISDNKHHFLGVREILKISADNKKNRIFLICLAGFMKILSKNFIKKFNGKILNIHPSLLPKYKGLNTHQRAIDNNEKFSGCTVHFVNSKLDSGKIILQKKINILKMSISYIPKLL